MTQIACQRCSRTVEYFEEFVSGDISCPHCGEKFGRFGERDSEAVVAITATPPLPAAAPVQLPAEADGATREPPYFVESWTTIRLGLGFLLASIWVSIAVVPISLFGMMVFFSRQHDQTTLMILVVMSLVVAAAAGVIVLLRLVGIVLCCWAPRRRGARVLAVITLVLMLAGVLIAGFSAFREGLQAAFRLDPLIRSVSIGPDSYGDLAAAANTLATIVFLFYLRAVALNLQDDSLTRNIRNMLFFIAAGVCSIGAMFGLMVWVAGGLDKNKEPPMAMIAMAGCMLLVFTTVFLAWLIINLVGCRKALANQVVGRQQER